MWLVGSQIRPGTYSASVQDGCYWERLKNFSNTIGGVIANDFVSSAGVRRVTIKSSDLGFSTDDDCGVWIREDGAVTESSTPDNEGSSDNVYKQWTMRRVQKGGGKLR